MFAVLSSLVLLLSSTNVLVGASSVSAATDVSGAAVGVPTSSHRQRRHLRAAAAAAHHKRAGRGLDDATEALEAAEEAEEEEEEAEPVDEPTELGWTDLELTQLNEEDEEGRDTIPEAPAEEERDTIPEVPAEEDLTPEEVAAAAELVGESKSTGDDAAEVVAEETAPAEDEAPADTDTTEEEESPAMGSTEDTSEEPTDGEDEDTATTTTEEEAPMDEEILDELVNEEDELPEDVVEVLNDEIEDILDAVNAVTSGEPTPMGDGSDALDEDTEQQWTPVGAPTVEDEEPVPAPTVDYGNDEEEGPAPTVDYFDFKYTPEPTKPYNPPDEEYDPLDGIDAEVEETESYGSTGNEPVESPFEDGTWQDEAYKKAYDWLNGTDGEENMAEVARDQRVKVAVGVLLGLGITLALHHRQLRPEQPRRSVRRLLPPHPHALPLHLPRPVFALPRVLRLR